MDKTVTNRVNELYDMLIASGGDVDKIAQPFMNDLNEAVQRYNDQKEERQKLKDATALADHFNTFVEVWYPEGQSKITGEEIIEILQFTSDLFNPNLSAEDMINRIFSDNPLKKVTPKEIPTKKTGTKTLAQMVKEMNW